MEFYVKKLVLTVVAGSLAFSPTLSLAQGHRQAPPPRIGVKKPQHNSYRSWHKGDRFDRRYAQNYQVVDYRRYRGLKAPPRGYHYVRSGNDAVLVGVTSGIVAAVIANAIR